MKTGPLEPPRFLTFSVTFKNPSSVTGRQHALRRLAEAVRPMAAIVEGDLRVDAHDCERWRIVTDPIPPKPQEPKNRVMREGGEGGLFAALVRAFRRRSA